MIMQCPVISLHCPGNSLIQTGELDFQWAMLHEFSMLGLLSISYYSRWQRGDEQMNKTFWGHPSWFVCLWTTGKLLIIGINMQLRDYRIFKPNEFPGYSTTWLYNYAVLIQSFNYLSRFKNGYLYLKPIDNPRYSNISYSTVYICDTVSKPFWWNISLSNGSLVILTFWLKL